MRHFIAVPVCNYHPGRLSLLPPWDGKMSTSQRAVMLAAGKVTAGLAESNGSLPPGG